MKKNGFKKHYSLGGSLFWQKGYKRSGKFVKPHFKTHPDGDPKTNRKAILGY